MKKTIVLFALASMLSFPACYAQETVATVLSSCTDLGKSETVVQQARQIKCMAYLSGLFDAFRLMSDMIGRGIPADKLRMCPPADGVTNDKVVEIALTQMRNKVDLNSLARTAAFIAWAQAYKCK